MLTARYPIERVFLQDMGGCGWYCIAVLRVREIELHVRLGAWSVGPKTLGECTEAAIACAREYGVPGKTLGFENGEAYV